MKPNWFDNADPVKILSFLKQVKMACDINRVPESVAMWVLPFFLAKSPTASFTIRVTLRDDINVLTYRKVLFCYCGLVFNVQYSHRKLKI